MMNVIMLTVASYGYASVLKLSVAFFLFYAEPSVMIAMRTIVVLIVLSTIMPNVAMRNVIVLNVVAPNNHLRICLLLNFFTRGDSAKNK